MKARVMDNKIILSIGMIVKNEEKDLGDCLESLRPLMEAVPSELIIVDTGSTDATIEIAQKYTEKIYSFEWVNDFSAARNFGVDKANGQWFLQVDADDRLQDPAEMIAFLNNEKENKKYYTANILYHSYTNKEHTSYSDARIIRLFRLGVGNRFYGSIHETPRRIIPTKELPTVVDHYGYIYETLEDAEKKRERNNTLLEKELEADPDNIRLIDHYAVTCQFEKKMELLEHGRELCRKEPEHFYFSNIYWKLSRHLYILKKYEEVIEVSDEYFRLTTQDHVGDIEICFNLGNAYYQLNEYGKALEEFKRYLDLYDRYQDGSLQKQDTMCAVTERVSPQNRESVLCQIVCCSYQMKEYEKVLDEVGKIGFSHISSNLLIYIQQILQVSIKETGNYKSLFDLEVWSGDERAERAQKQAMEAFLADRCLEISGSGGWERLQELAKGKESPMAKAVLASSGLATDEIWDSFREEFCERREVLEEYVLLPMAAGMRYQRDLLPLLYQVGRDCFKQAAMRIVEKVPDILDVVAAYQPSEAEGEDLLWRGWMVEVDSQAFQKAEGDGKLPILRRLMEDFSWYVNHLYRVNLLCPEKLPILPSAHRFGYWAGLALDAEKAGKDKEYLRFLREASRSCPEMSDAVKLLLKEFEEKDEQYQRQKEQKELAKKIKGIIEGMILGGQKEDAKAVLSQYELIAPDDVDIPSLKAAILQQPSFAET